MKKYILLSLLSLNIGSLFTVRYIKDSRNLQKNHINQQRKNKIHTISIEKNPVIAYSQLTARQLQSYRPRISFGWDLNSVILPKKIEISTLLRYAKKERGYFGALKSFAQFGKLLRKKKSLKKKGDPRGYVWDAMFTDLEKKDKKLANFLRNVVQKVNDLDTGMINLMMKLSHQGHTHSILSNMGQGILTTQIKLIEKDESVNPKVKAYILRFLKDPIYKVISSEDNKWLHKPFAPIYEEWIDKNKNYIRGFKLFVFIDDKLENVKAALDNGFHIGIHYPKGSTSKDLEAILNTMNLL